MVLFSSTITYLHIFWMDRLLLNDMNLFIQKIFSNICTTTTNRSGTYYNTSYINFRNILYLCI